jgi:putative acetyltransferase
LLDHSLARARVLGFRVVVLQTATILGDAIALYRRAGFRPYEPAHRVPRCDVALRLDLVESATAESRPTGGQP